MAKIKSSPPRTGAKNPGGGGLNMRNHVKTPVKVGGPSTKKIDVCAVSYLGTKQGSHVTQQPGEVRSTLPPLVSGTAPQVKSGNAAALEGAGAGARPGGGNRKIYPAGLQSPTPAVSAPQSARPILSEYGPEITKRGG